MREITEHTVRMRYLDLPYCHMSCLRSHEKVGFSFLRRARVDKEIQQTQPRRSTMYFMQFSLHE